MTGNKKKNRRENMSCYEILRTELLKSEKAEKAPLKIAYYTERLEAFINQLKNEPLVQKHLYKGAWISGCQTEVPPISIKLVNHSVKITLQWDDSRYYFSKFINRVVKENRKIITGGKFHQNDGSCPAEIVFFSRPIF